MEKKQEIQKITDEDTELIEAINSGKKDLFNDLVKKYEKKIYQFGLRMCREPRDAEEMVQDTFLNTYRFLKYFRQETKFKNWLFKIASSACLRKKRNNPVPWQNQISLEDFFKREGTNPTDQLPTWVSEPLENILNQESSEVIRKSISLIPEKYRLVLVLRDLEGFSTEETARILKLKPVTVKVRLHRARLYLKEKLKDYFEHEH